MDSPASLDDIVSAASSAPSDASSSSPLLSLPSETAVGVLSLADRIARSPRAGSKSIAGLRRGSPAAPPQSYPQSDDTDMAGLKIEHAQDEQPMQPQQPYANGDQQPMAVKCERVEAKDAPDDALLTDSDKRATLRAALKGSELRRRREGSDIAEPALSSHKRTSTDIAPLRPAPPPPPRLLLRASSRVIAPPSALPPSAVATPPQAQSPTSSSAPGASPSTASHPPGLAQAMSRSSTRNLFASLSKGVALFSASPAQGAASEDEENREWLQRRLSKQDEPAQHSDTSLASSSTVTSDPNASWLSTHSHVLVFCHERVFPSLLVLLVLIQLIMLPLRLALSLPWSHWRMYDLPLDVLYVVGVLFTDYVEVTHGGESGQKAEGADHAAVSDGGGSLSIRLRSTFSRRMFVFDLLSTVPYYLFVPSSSLVSLFADPIHATPDRLNSLLRLPRLLRAPRLSSFLEQLELFNLVQSIISPAIFRLASFVVWMYLFAHFAGCAWWLTSYIEGLPDDEWVVQADMREGSFSKLYLHLLFVGFKCVSHTTLHFLLLAQ